MARYNAPASWLVLILLLLARCHALAAQSLDMLAFYDSVSHISDVDQLRSMLSRTNSRTADNSPDMLTERGFIALRLSELTSQRNSSQIAAESFKKALKRQPAFGWAHYGLGLTYVNKAQAGPGTFVLDEVLGDATGSDSRSRAHREFKQAIAAQPSVPFAAGELAENAVARNKRKTLEDAVAVLHQRTAASPDDGAAWFALGRVEAELGKLDTARIALENAAAHGVNSAEANHTRATLLLRLRGHETEGAKAWFDGLHQLTPEISELYFNDIEALLSKDERAAWKNMDLAKRADFLRTFWDMRAALAGITVADRMSEHYRRLAFVRSQYYRQTPYGAPDMNALRQLPYSQRSVYDDRGLIYIRHGAPRQRVGGNAGSTFDSWAYAALDGGPDRVFHFERDADGEDFHLMHKISCNSDWLNDRVELDSKLGLLAAHCTGTDALAASADIRQVAFDALATDSDHPKFLKDLPFYFDLFTFRATEGRTSVVAAVAVPREKLNMTEVAANPAYRIDLSLILVDTLTRKVIREDDSLMLATEHNHKEDLFRLHVEIAVPPSRTTVQRLIVSDPTEPGVGQLYGGPFPIPDYTGSKLMLSDIVLAEPGVKGKWHRGDVSLALVPTRYFKGGKFNVFYEVYNLAPNANYSTEVEIEPIRRTTGQKLKSLFGGSSTIRFRFEGQATNVKNGTMQELRRVDAPLGAGDYRMRITVKNLDNGETTRNERTFTIPK